MIRRGLFHPRYKKYFEIVPCLRRKKMVTTTTGESILSSKNNLGTQKVSELRVGDIVTFLNMGAYNSCSEFFFNCPHAKELLIFKNNIVPMKSKSLA